MINAGKLFYSFESLSLWWFLLVYTSQYHVSILIEGVCIPQSIVNFTWLEFLIWAMRATTREGEGSEDAALRPVDKEQVRLKQLRSL